LLPETLPDTSRADPSGSPCPGFRSPSIPQGLQFLVSSPWPSHSHMSPRGQVEKRAGILLHLRRRLRTCTAPRRRKVSTG
jgi:hypothetical protein